MTRAGLAAALAVAPGAAAAHEAFGDLGPFHANLLHPAADPMQGVVLAGAAAFLARQPVSTVRPAYAALALAGAAAVAAATLGLAPGLGGLAAAGLACVLGALAATGLQPPAPAAAALAAAAGIGAGLALTAGPGLRDLALGFLGGALGVALVPLLLWGLLERVGGALGPVVPAVAGAWVAAVGIMMAALAA